MKLIEDIKLGVYMVSFNEWNIDGRRYQQRYIDREAYLIENGKLKSIRNIRASNNLQRILEGISAFGRKSHHIHWWEVNTPVSTPYVLVGEVGITRATR